MDQPAIIIKNLYKSFRLPHEHHSGIKSVIVNFYKRKKGYETQKVLRNVSFEIKKGEFFGIVGRNGSGKSTLLKLMAGIYAPDKGLIHVNGTLTPFIELGVGFNPELTGRENVFLNGALLGFSRTDMEKIYDEIVQFAELERFMDQKLKNYSSGMQVRLAFSIAIRADSDVLLIDEVLAVGDAQFQEKCFEYFRQLKKSERTIVFISHSMESVRQFCDRALFLKNGKVQLIGEPREVALEYMIDNTEGEPLTVESTPHEKPQSGIKIKSLYVKNQGRKDNRFKVDDFVEVVIRVEAAKKSEVACALSLVNIQGVYVAGFNTRNTLGLIKLPKGGVKEFICRIPVHQLTAGAYHINAAIVQFESGQLLDYQDVQLGMETPIIHVLEGDSSKDGIFNIQGTWAEL